MKSEAASLQNAAKRASSLKDALGSPPDLKDSPGMKRANQGTVASEVKPASASGNDGAPFQVPTTKEPKVSSNSTSKILTTKHSATMEPTQSSHSQADSSIEGKHKQINQLSTLIETSFGNHRAEAKSDRLAVSANVDSANAKHEINHSDSGNVNFPATNRSHGGSEAGSVDSSNAVPNSVSVAYELNSFKSASVKKDTKQARQIDYETQATSVNIENPEEDKLCFGENGWPTTECSESAVSNCTFPYSGLTYRLCYSSCQWSKVDTSQCKLSSLAEIHNLVSTLS